MSGYWPSAFLSGCCFIRSRQPLLIINRRTVTGSKQPVDIMERFAVKEGERWARIHQNLSRHKRLHRSTTIKIPDSDTILCSISRLVTLNLRASLWPNCTFISLKTQKSHLHGTSRGAELHAAILRRRTKWIQKRRRTRRYQIFICFMQKAILLRWEELCKIE